MIVRDAQPGRPAWVATLLLAALLVAALAPTAVRAEEENAAWKPVTLLYLTDVKGKVEPCG